MHARSVSSSSTLGRIRRPTATTVSAAEHQRVRLARRDRLGFFARQSKRVIARKLALHNTLVDVGGNDGIGRDPNPCEQVETPRACRGEDETQVQVPWGPGPPRPGMKR